MSFPAYLDTIKAKTGKDPSYFLAVAQRRGLLTPTIKTGEIITWLAKDFDLGRGHAMALIVTFKDATLPKETSNERLSRHFGGKKAVWKQPYEDLLTSVMGFGSDTAVKLGGTYISLLRAGRKFAIIQITANRMDIGIKRKGIDPIGPFQTSGNWNSMVTHRVQVTMPVGISKEIIDWLRAAYDAT